MTGLLSVPPIAPAQSRRASLAEAVANVVVGFFIALVAQHLLFPLFDLHVGAVEHGVIAAAFTGVSLVRSYLLRRLFLHIDACRERERQQRRQSLERRLASGRLK